MKILHRSLIPEEIKNRVTELKGMGYTELSKEEIKEILNKKYTEVFLIEDPEEKEKLIKGELDAIDRYLADGYKILYHPDPNFETIIYSN